MHALIMFALFFGFIYLFVKANEELTNQLLLGEDDQSSPGTLPHLQDFLLRHCSILMKQPNCGIINIPHSHYGNQLALTC